jgi:arabinofuranosyltransferase
MKTKCIESVSNKNLNYIIYFLLALFVYVFIMNAWVGDDAYITFRTVDNFVNGYGLTWNVSERVQAYTHPLWMFLHSFFYLITGNIYITTMILSFAFSFAALYLLVFKLSDNKLNAIAGLIVLLISKIFIDYTSSGLENPLTYFLIILFLIYYFKDYDAKKKIFILSLITSLAALNRLDTVLLFLPALLYLLVKNWKAKYLLQVLNGFIPLIIWEIFSVIYYGFPLPNTYYAKLNTGIPFSEYLSQGINYYIDLFQRDLMSGFTIFVGLFIATIYSVKNKTGNVILPLIIGIILYLLYILRIGGDFMCGRFFAAPFLMITAIMTIFQYSKKSKGLKLEISITVVVLIILSAFTSYHPLLTGAGFGSENGIGYDTETKDKVFRAPSGIVDERGIYYPDTGLLRMIKLWTTQATLPDVAQAIETSSSQSHTIVRGMIGVFGYYAGQKVKIIDFLALSDPFLARLKASKNPDWKGEWRIGHFYRRMPTGYI